MGRVVITHSTYIDGLIPLLQQLARDARIETITPAVIARARGRSSGLVLRISTPITGGFKMLARRGTSAQEVFVVTRMERLELQARIDQLLKD